MGAWRGALEEVKSTTHGGIRMKFGMLTGWSYGIVNGFRLYFNGVGIIYENGDSGQDIYSCGYCF